MIKKLISVILIVALAFCVSPTVFAAEDEARFSDVSSDAVFQIPSIQSQNYSQMQQW